MLATPRLRGTSRAKAEDRFMASTNGGAPPAGAAEANAAAPQLNVLGPVRQGPVVREPERAASIQQQQQQPKINIQINVNAKPLAEHDFEVELKIEGRAEVPNMLLFSFDLLYAGIFRILNVPQENLHAMVMIECPRLLFPFAREIIANAVRNGGFPPLLIDPVDFVSLYRQRIGRGAAQPARRAASRSRRQIVVPDRLFAERRHEGAVRLRSASEMRGAAARARTHQR